MTDDWEVGGKIKIKKRYEQDDYEEGNTKEDRKTLRKRMEKEQRRLEKKRMEMEKESFRRS